MSRSLLFAALILFLTTGAARAQGTPIYKCIDSNGRPLYTSEKSDMAGKKCESISKEVNVVPSQKPRTSGETPRGYPRETPAQRSAAKEKQQETLQRELAKEQELLAEAKKALADQEAVRSGNERNYARVLERLRPYQESVELHEKNIEALRRELANLYK
jgi:type IV secretory pathway VirB10-like protein